MTAALAGGWQAPEATQQPHTISQTRRRKRFLLVYAQAGYWVGMATWRRLDMAPLLCGTFLKFCC